MEYTLYYRDKPLEYGDDAIYFGFSQNSHVHVLYFARFSAMDLGTTSSVNKRI